MAEPAPVQAAKPIYIIGSVTWRTERKRGASNYGSDAEIAEVTVLVLEGGTAIEAFSLAKAQVKLALGPEPASHVEKQSAMGSPARASTQPAPRGAPSPAAPATFTAQPMSAQPPGDAKPCPWGCGQSVVWKQTEWQGQVKNSARNPGDGSAHFRSCTKATKGGPR